MELNHLMEFRDIVISNPISLNDDTIINLEMQVINYLLVSFAFLW